MKETKRIEEVRYTMRIRELRHDANMTQSELAAKIGVSTQAVSNYELGKRYVPVSLLPAIKDALGCTWEDLFGENSTTNGG
jgi:transcriptional regulator with XRE-family HTH domain